MNVTVVGLGKIGLPLAVQFAKKGANVFGADINQETVDLVNKGIEPFPKEENLQKFLSEVVNSGNLSASTSTVECVSESDGVVVVVPLFVNSAGEPDFRAIDSATEEIAKGLKKGTLVVYETTLPIGTTRNRFTRTLEELSEMTAGKDFHVAFSPERVLTGRVFSDLRKYPKVVGGVTGNCAEKAAKFYSTVLDFDARPDLRKKNGVWIVASAEAAEFTKLAETTYRDVNIGLANQFSLYATKIGVNIHEVIDAANSQPFSHLHNPGVSVGGHCIPIYPQLYLHSDVGASIVRAARMLNAKMPLLAIERLSQEFGSLVNQRILILGASYRANVKETAFSGVYDLIHEIERQGGHPEVIDTMFSPEELFKLGITPFGGKFAEIRVAIIQNEDLSHKDLLSDSQLFPNLELILDGRNLFKHEVSVGFARIISI
jgi:nucleotide sugar dehydrogenase